MAGNLLFANSFEELTGYPPMPWQESLYRQFIEIGDFSRPLSLPTGLGKTTVIHIWLLALASRPELVPRRLVYVVNRRTIVDQATSEAEKLRNRLMKLPSLAAPLKAICAIESDPPLAISTLRGQFADNGEWSIDPTRPAIVIGTVDMIGSRLLFSGYGRGFKHRPLHAGFLGQDTLLVHDEAHLEPAFQDLLESIKAEQKRCGEFRSFHVMPLTATPQANAGEPFTLTEEDYENPVVRKRLQAKKAISLHTLDDEKTLAEQVSTLALKHKDSGQAILVFARKVEDVKKVSEVLVKSGISKDQIGLLTGTIRGLERDRLIDTPVFQRFMEKGPRHKGSPTAYLICTSAGEVGVDISGDHLVSDLTPFDSMAQRFGRINRYGDGEAQVNIVHPEEFDEEAKDGAYQKARRLTLLLLKQLNGDGSPRALLNLRQHGQMSFDIEAAFNPKPATVPVTDVLFDAWALTSVCRQLADGKTMPGCLEVADWLHGVREDWQPAETHVAWRAEVEFVSNGLHVPEDLLSDYPLKPHELLRDRSDRVLGELQLLAKKHGSRPAWLLDDRQVRIMTLAELADGDLDEIAWRTVLLPPSVGGLDDFGMLDGKAVFGGNPAKYDVADMWFEDKESQIPRRRRAWDEAEIADNRMRLIREIDFRPDDDGDIAAEEDDSGEHNDETPRPPGKVWKWYALPRWSDDGGSRTAALPVKWEDHTYQVAEYARRIVEALRLPAALQAAITFAARVHDLGKQREVWQLSIGNPSPKDWYAKSGRNWKPLEITRYRHEFGSLLDLLDPNQPCHADLKRLTEDMRELTLHLIAAHHGRARPHFPMDEVFDYGPRASDAYLVAADIPGRFARLQRIYGRWGLAWLESILRAADAAASAKPIRAEDKS